MRWSIPLVLAFVVFGSGDADAQAFKRRGNAPAKAAPAKASPAKKSTAKKSTAKKSTKKSRVASQGRTDDLTPEADEPKKAAPEEADDYVVIEDDDE